MIMTTVNNNKQKLYDGLIGYLSYIQQKTEHQFSFKQYCTERGMQQDEKSAQTFLEWQLVQEQIAHTEYLD